MTDQSVGLCVCVGGEHHRITAGDCPFTEALHSSTTFSTTQSFHLHKHSKVLSLNWGCNTEAVYNKGQRRLDCCIFFKKYNFPGNNQALLNCSVLHFNFLILCIFTYLSFTSIISHTKGKIFTKILILAAEQPMKTKNGHEKKELDHKCVMTRHISKKYSDNLNYIQ